jgi:pantoate--beta-alanine ligase
VKVVESLEALRRARRGVPEPVGLVPTMGYLHAGHLSLVERARRECRSTVVSIFVNPTQFGPAEDLAAYPRDLPRDLAALEGAGVDLVWTPSPEVMYPPGFQTWVTVEAVSLGLEGERRPGHFRGVATVVSKLFHAVQPQKAYFGQKDAQQAVVIRRMALDLDFPVEVVICPTVREADGLAMSSRNAYLGAEERRAAPVLYRALEAARRAFVEGVRDAESLRETMRQVLAREPLARLQYVSAADPETLQELDGPVGGALLSMAVYIGRTRLIDNAVVTGEWPVASKGGRPRSSERFPSLATDH